MQYLKGNTSDTKEQVIKTGKIELTLTESYDNINKKITVMSDEDGLMQEETYDFNIKNTGDAPAKYDLKLINEVPSTYTGKVLRYKVYKDRTRNKWYRIWSNVLRKSKKYNR